MPDPPGPVQDKFEQLQEQKDSYLQLRNISGGWYVQRSTSVWDKEEKKPKKVTTHLGTITDDGEFVPKTPQKSIPESDREIFEYANGQLAYALIEDVHDSLAEFTPYADELVAMAIVQAIDPKPLRLHADRWKKLYLSQQHDVRMGRNHLSDVLKQVGTGKGWWHDFFETLHDDEFLLYDLSTVFTYSKSIKRAERGYNPEQKHLPQLGTILAFSTETNLPTGVDVFWGSMRDISTFKEFLALLEPSEMGFIVDRGLFSQELIEQFRERGINYVVPLRKNSSLIDLRWLHWQEPFLYRDRGIRWARRHTDLGTVYLFDDPLVRGEQEKTLLRRQAKGEITEAEYEQEKKQAGIIPLLSDLDEPGDVVYDLYKGRHDVELAFDAMKNHLDADKTHLQSDEAVRGYFFMTFLALRIYFGVLNRLREEDLTDEISVEEAFYQLSKVERVLGPGEKDSFGKIPKQARDVTDHFSDHLPRV
jgi:hypothetical protein